MNADSSAIQVRTVSGCTYLLPTHVQAHGFVAALKRYLMMVDLLLVMPRCAAVQHAYCLICMTGPEPDMAPKIHGERRPEQPGFPWRM